MTGDDPEVRKELAGRVLNAEGDIVQFVTLTAADPEHDAASKALAVVQTNALVRELEGTQFRLVDRHGDEVTRPVEDADGE